MQLSPLLISQLRADDSVPVEAVNSTPGNVQDDVYSSSNNLTHMKKKKGNRKKKSSLATTVTVSNPKLQADTGSLSVKAEEILQSELGNI